MLYESQYYGICITDDFLCHHGILGQKWGKRNGPPYPLDGDDHSSRERKMHWRRSLSRGSNSKVNTKLKKKVTSKTNNSKQIKKAVVRTDKSDKQDFHLSDRQKTALKIGAAAAVAGLAIYGGYKLSQTDTGRNIKGLMPDLKQPFDNIMTGIKGEELPDIGHTEGILDRMSKINPENHTDNCLPSAIAGQARLMGKDVTAQALNSGNRLPMHKAIKKCFDGAQILTDDPGNRELASTFAKSRKDAEELLVKKFGQNASGIIGFNWSPDMGGGGHAFNYQIFNGHVVFSDYQNSFTNDHHVINNFWDMNAIDGNKYICITNLAGSSLKHGVSKFVSKAA